MTNQIATPERTERGHVLFWGSFLSNWYHSPFTYDGQHFNNSEAAFMYCKAKHFNDPSMMLEIIKKQRPDKVKALGRQVKKFTEVEWVSVRYNYMLNVLREKFNQNPEMKKLLLTYKGCIIVEASPKDVIWGVGLHWSDDLIFDPNNWKGLNLLGKALMELITCEFLMDD